MKDAPNKKSSMWPSADVAPWSFGMSLMGMGPSKENAPASRHVNLFVFQFWSMLFARSSLRFDGAKHQYYQKDNKVAEGRHPFALFRNPGMIKSPKVNANHCRGSSMHSKRCKREEGRFLRVSLCDPPPKRLPSFHEQSHLSPGSSTFEPWMTAGK